MYICTKAGPEAPWTPAFSCQVPPHHRRRPQTAFVSSSMPRYAFIIFALSPSAGGWVRVGGYHHTAEGAWQFYCSSGFPLFTMDDRTRGSSRVIYDYISVEVWRTIVF